MSAIVVEQTRGPLVENIYRADAVVVTEQGNVVFHVGDPGKVTFWRSAAKPIQAMPVVLSGAADAFGFGSEHLAIFSSSHNGESVHTETVLKAMKLAGISPDLLQCGPHRPFDRMTADSLTREGREPEPIHNNCSGKHTGMLALARHLGLPVDNYMDPDSELQKLILANVADVVGLPPESIYIGVDGCGVPVFGMPLRNMAYGYARLANPAAMPQGKEEAGRRFRDAMLQHPYLIGGRRRICTAITSLPGNRFVAKVGADGVYCVGILPDAVAQSPLLQAAGVQGGVGVAVKAEDGSKDISHMTAVEVLDQLGLLTDSDREALAHWRAKTVKNWAGKVVGEIRPVFRLERWTEADA